MKMREKGAMEEMRVDKFHLFFELAASASRENILFCEIPPLGSISNKHIKNGMESLCSAKFLNQTPPYSILMSFKS
jgi:hypothetical protein